MTSNLKWFNGIADHVAGILSFKASGFSRFVKLSPFLQMSEAATWRCFVEKVFLENSRNSQENTCNFIKRPATLFKKRL